MEKKQLISLIVPVYNAEKYISQCIEGILKQTYSDIEVILVDDGSTDRSGEICDEYAKKDNRIKVIHKENGGASSARNQGMTVAQGLYISFVDADDYVFPDYIEYLYNMLTEYEADISVGTCLKLSEGKKTDSQSIKEQYDNTAECFTSEAAIENLLYRKGITGYPVLKLFKKNCIENEKFMENVTYGEDFIFIYHALRNASKVVLGRKIIYIYYQNADSVNHKKIDVQKYRVSWETFEKEIYSVISQTENKKLVKALDSKALIYALDFCTRLVKIREAEALYKKLKKCIKKYCVTVCADNKAKKSNRIIAVLCKVNVTMTLYICVFFLKIKKVLGYEIKNSL